MLQLKKNSDEDRDSFDRFLALYLELIIRLNRPVKVGVTRLIEVGTIPYFRSVIILVFI